MDPITTSLLVSAASNIPGMILGGSQLLKSNRMNPERPEYEIPEAERQALELAKSMAAESRIPGQSAIEGRLDQTTANTLATIERMGYGGASDINAASRAYGNQLEKETELGVAGAQLKQQNERNLEQALSRMGTYEDKQWKLNEYDPFQQESAAKAALYEGGMQNLFGGLKDTTGGISNILLADAMKTGGYNPVTTQPTTQSVQTQPQTTMQEIQITPNNQFDWLSQSFINQPNRYKSVFENPIR